MNDIPQLHGISIDWNLTPEDAVTMYLEWGNNNWHGDHAPVRSKSDYSVYFIVDTWETPTIVRLIRRNSEQAEELLAFPLPDELIAGWQKENGKLRGISAPSPAIREWLQKKFS